MNFTNYKNSLVYPKAPKKTTISFSSGLYKKELEKYNNEMQAFYDEEKALYEKFKLDALKNVGLLNHPKANKAFDFAWEHGHSSGHEEVYGWLVEAADLIL